MDRNKEQQRLNKEAFVEVLGNPYDVEEPQGWYNVLKQRSRVTAVSNSVEGKPTINPARPTPSDFFCDVELLVEKSLPTSKQLTRFINSYILGCELMSAAECFAIEQKLGKRLRRQHISPVVSYFKSIRTKRKGTT